MCDEAACIAPRQARDITTSAVVLSAGAIRKPMSMRRCSAGALSVTRHGVLRWREWPKAERGPAGQAKYCSFPRPRPSTPLAPGLLSTTTDWPRASEIFWPSRRAPTSLPAPRPKGIAKVWILVDRAPRCKRHGIELRPVDRPQQHMRLTLGFRPADELVFAVFRRGFKSHFYGLIIDTIGNSP